jgi:hypothetical protein
MKTNDLKVHDKYGVIRMQDDNNAREGIRVSRMICTSQICASICNDRDKEVLPYINNQYHLA